MDFLDLTLFIWVSVIILLLLTSLRPPNLDHIEAWMVVQMLHWKQAQQEGRSSMRRSHPWTFWMRPRYWRSAEFWASERRSTPPTTGARASAESASSPRR